MVTLCADCREANKHLVGTTQYLPKGFRTKIQPEEIIRLRSQGLSVAKIAVKNGVTVRRIFQILAEHRRQISKGGDHATGTL